MVREKCVNNYVPRFFVSEFELMRNTELIAVMFFKLSLLPLCYERRRSHANRSGNTSGQKPRGSSWFMKPRITKLRCVTNKPVSSPGAVHDERVRDAIISASVDPQMILKFFKVYNALWKKSDKGYRVFFTSCWT